MIFIRILVVAALSSSSAFGAESSWTRGRQADLEAGLAGLETEISSLERLSERGERRPASLAAGVASASAGGGELWRAAKLVSAAIDRLGSPNQAASLELRARANDFNARLAKDRDRLLALQRRHSIFTGGLAGLAAPIRQPVPSAALAQPRPAAIARALDDMSASASRQRAFRASARLFAQEQARTALLESAHKRGESETLGDPRGRAGLVHRQSGQTCAIVAAQQLLLEYGALPFSESAARQEDALYEESVSRGYFRGARRDGGTPWQYVGDLLQDHDLITLKRMRASEADLEAAVAAGKMVLADVDSSVFWHNRSYHDATHSIVVTGLERSRAGALLGYYVNDSDRGVYFSAGRLVTADTFLKAWKARGSRFVEVR